MKRKNRNVSVMTRGELARLYRKQVRGRERIRAWDNKKRNEEDVEEEEEAHLPKFLLFEEAPSTDLRSFSSAARITKPAPFLRFLLWPSPESCGLFFQGVPNSDQQFDRSQRRRRRCRSRGRFSAMDSKVTQSAGRTS